MQSISPINPIVLVVDDDPGIGHIMSEMLKLEGYEPVACMQPIEAIQLAAKIRPDIAFVDINMPEMDGLELATILKQHNPRCEVVIMTGYGTFDNAVQAIKIGVQDYLVKPFHRTQLTFCLNRFRDRRAIKQRMRLAEQRYSELVQNIPLFIFIMARDFQLDFVNESCRAMFGYEPEEAVGDPRWFLSRVHPDDLDHISQFFQNAFQNKAPSFTTECRFLHRKGHVIHSMVQFIPYSETGTDVARRSLQGIIVNITDRVFLERALVQKEKLKTLGAISAEVAHEIRNPLVSIGGFARRLQKQHPESTEAEIILRECQRLERLLNQIRDYLRPVEVHSREYPVNKLLTECLQLLSPEIGPRCVQCSLEPDLPAVFVDTEVLQQVFINLIRNALVSMASDTTVAIRSFESNEHIHIEFENEMDPQSKVIDPEALFMPFEEGGKSIGLPLCYRLVKNMGGLLSFSRQGRQAIFTVSLPKTARVEE